MLIPAAQYVRMSTEHQQYSFENQKAAIALYAEDHGFAVVKTYDDAAKSGVVLKGRTGLKRLLRDVLSGSANYKAILVYDISRWGRFQDADEAAHYEFLCKHAGIPVHYCAEPFGNDDSTASMMMKALKRTMAGEYSRELSVKCYAGQKRIAQLGFLPGGRPGYGLRRMVVSPKTRRRRLLHNGEYKYVRTDRVVLAPGPQKEVEAVRRIYKLYMASGGQLGPTAIASRLNREGKEFRPGNPWDRYKVFRILRNPKYAGYNVWGRKKQKLHGPQVRNPREQWVLVPKAFPAIVRPQHFENVQKMAKNRPRKFSEKQLLRKLTTLLRRKGRITKALMESCKGMPDRSCYQRHFGGMQKAYDLIGYRYPLGRFSRAGQSRFTKQLRDRVTRQIVTLFPGHVTLAPNAHPYRPLLLIDKMFKVYVITCRFNIKKNKPAWFLRFFPRDRDTIALLCLLNRANDDPSVFFVVPRITTRCHSEHSFEITAELLAGGERLNGLQDFYRCAMLIHRQVISGFL